MNMKRTVIMMCVAVMAVVSWAQPKFTVTHDVANLGEIMYQVPAKVVFKVRNTGSEDLTLTEVLPSCGCTAVDWTRSPIASGEEGEIVVTYDAKMLGVFQKDIEVFTNASDQPYYLVVQGRVVSEVADYSGSFPIDLGNIRLNLNNVEFDDVNKGDRPVVELQVLNMGRKAYKPQLMHLPNYLEAHYAPEVLAGGRIGKITLTLNTDKLDEMGLIQNSIYIARKEGDRVSEDNEIAVSVVMLPDFSSLSVQERSLAPKMELSAQVVEMGDMGKKRRKRQDLFITNAGQSPLEIRSLQVFNKALGVSLSDRTIEPGMSARMRVTVSAEVLRKEKTNTRILLITNDPSRPKEIITVNVK